MCDLAENHNLLKLKLNHNSLTDALIESILTSIEKSKLIKFVVGHNCALCIVHCVLCIVHRALQLSKITNAKIKQVITTQKLKIELILITVG